MAAVGATNPTLIDVASRTEGGKVASTIVELLAETNDIIQDATFLEANDGSSHKTTIRSGLPTATWRQLNYGVQPSKSTTVQVKDACGMLEAYAEIDKALADLNGNTSAFRLSEDRAHLEGMNQAFADTLIYGNTATNPERFMGLAPRYNSTSAQNGSNVILGGGSGSDNTSIWLVVWSPNTVHGLFPKGSKAGLSHRDLGEVTLEDAANGRFQGYRTHYKWDCGLSVRDWRYVVRIANIDTSELVKTGATGADLQDLMVQALELVPNLGMGRPAFYCNRTISSFLRRQIVNKSNLHLGMDEIGGKKVMSFAGVPVRRVDAILNSEATIS
jgi:hypothetical protein